MKRVYWFLLLFGVWCVAAALWYTFGVKGISRDIRFFDPHLTWVAIVEILFMLLIACLLGYAMGWSLGEGPLNTLRQMNEQLEADKETLHAATAEMEEQIELSKQQLFNAHQASTLKINKANQEMDLLKTELSSLRLEISRVSVAEEDLQALRELEKETGSLRLRVQQLDFFNQQLEDVNRKLRLELEEALAARHAIPEPIHPFVRPVEMIEPDDLTQIKGIGPFIEKRLNMIGIYTLRQISELTPEMLEQVGKAIEFFPDRIRRDDWVGQATKLL